MLFGKQWAKKPIGIKGQMSQNPIEVLIVCIWISLILLKIENWKRKKKKFTIHFKITVHMPDCTVHVPWTVQEVLNLKKRIRKKNQPDADVRSTKRASQMHLIVLDTTERFAHHPPWHWYLWLTSADLYNTTTRQRLIMFE